MRMFRVTVKLADPPSNNYSAWFERLTVKIKAESRDEAARMAQDMIDRHLWNRTAEEVEVTAAA